MSERVIMRKQIVREYSFSEEVKSFETNESNRTERSKRLARHLLYSFKGTIDDEDETLTDWFEEVEASFAGKYGPILKRHSFYIEEGKAIIGSGIVSLFREIPLIIYLAVDPEKRGQGLSKKILQQMLYSFESSEYQEVYLVVTPGNFPAEKLYAKLGFKPVGTNWDKVMKSPLEKAN
ncbi:GNAT family N-acetyltransferase [Enterococcus rivorum]|uniref:N-acetyltransferase domain-containing protein n=1 Tax=Enterococcus rivorum TaxID=762845 RepID=A0A1E5KZC7_9ENTE|nr:GNAT family N-acetyltransferase [Enterococcus rivorum]MBP2097590.1 RimJ/RimL family protein N-acetyltransferase [Enterococcus rivorum]OEH83039.1 hypothetical protein BCR26_01850 [Enterococcus rivorum]